MHTATAVRADFENNAFRRGPLIVAVIWSVQWVNTTKWRRFTTSTLAGLRTSAKSVSQQFHSRRSSHLCFLGSFQALRATEDGRMH